MGIISLSREKQYEMTLNIIIGYNGDELLVLWENEYMKIVAYGSRIHDHEKVVVLVRKLFNQWHEVV